MIVLGKLEYIFGHVNFGHGHFSRIGGTFNMTMHNIFISA